MTGFPSFGLLPLTRTEIIIYCPGDAASGAAIKASPRRACSSPRIEYVLWKMAALTGKQETARGPLLYTWQVNPFFFPLTRTIF